MLYEVQVIEPSQLLRTSLLVLPWLYNTFTVSLVSGFLFDNNGIEELALLLAIGIGPQIFIPC